MLHGFGSRRRGVARLVALGGVSAALMLSRSACPPLDPNAVRTAEVTQPAPGVTVSKVHLGFSTVRVIEADLGHPDVRLEIAAEAIKVRDGRVSGRARTLPEWLETTGAVAGVNGGFFGASVDNLHKEIVGLLKLDGRVRTEAPIFRAKGSAQSYSHSALGLAEHGKPEVAWVTSAPGRPQLLRRHTQPELQGDGAPWKVSDAIACGPQLVGDGKIQVTDREERLASPGLLPRTFLGHAKPPGQTRKLVLCAADGMDYADCARFLMEYFQRRYGVPCSEGMCLDGGSSTQAAWREGADSSQIHTAPNPGTTVPTALLIHSRRTRTTDPEARPL